MQKSDGPRITGVVASRLQSDRVHSDRHIIERTHSVAIDSKTKERLEQMARSSRRSRKQQLAVIVELFYKQFAGLVESDDDVSDFDNI